MGGDSCEEESSLLQKVGGEGMTSMLKEKLPSDWPEKRKEWTLYKSDWHCTKDGSKPFHTVIPSQGRVRGDDAKYEETGFCVDFCKLGFGERWNPSYNFHPGGYKFAAYWNYWGKGEGRCVCHNSCDDDEGAPEHHSWQNNI